MHIQNKRRFTAFLAIVAALLLGVSALVYFQPIALIDMLSGAIHMENLASMTISVETGTGPRADMSTDDPTAMRGALSALMQAQVRRSLWPSATHLTLPGQTFTLRITDAYGKTAALDVVQREVALDGRNYFLLQPSDLSSVPLALSPVPPVDAHV